jgi:ankyrin repeat protein
VFCQLETLRHCLPASVRRTLDELPESLDETYERIIKEIKKPNRDHALRILQCLVVAIRPLEVEELAEVLAVDFDDAEGMAKLNPNWRWEDQEQALLSSCSSLIAIVESDEARIVQFSHFSVKEFLTSTRLATSNGRFSYYHIAPEPAHIILAQACMGVLLRSDNCIEQSDVRKSSPLAGYAAEHWVAHVQFGSVSSCLRKAMETLFDPDKPYFEAWLKLHDMDVDYYQSTFYPFSELEFRGTPLYYAALCGFQDLVEHLVINNPEHVNATGGYYVVPLIAALKAGHYQIAKFLRDNGAHPNVTGHVGRTPLHAAAWNAEFKIVEVLLEYKADVNARSADDETPLHFLFEHYPGGPNVGPSLAKVARLLLEHGADVNAQRYDRFTPLHNAAQHGKVEVVRVLLEHGADVNAPNNDRATALHIATQYGAVEVVRVLLEHGADVDAETEDGKTAFQLAGGEEGTEIWKLLSEWC